MSERILLINPSYESRDIVYFPLGLGHVAGACSREGIDVRCFDMGIEGGGVDRVVSDIRRNDHHVIGIGGFITQLRATVELSKAIKKSCPGAVVIAGGQQVVGCSRFVMEHSSVDVVCVGESEMTLPRLVHALYAQRDLTGIPSILYRRGADIVGSTDYSLAKDLDELDFPKYDAFRMESYIKGNYHTTIGKRSLDFLASRGCPYKCVFCTNSGKAVTVRYRSPENILKEIRLLKARFGINDLSFCDEIFTINKRKALEICEALRGEKISWITSCRADGLDEETLKAMMGSGCRKLLIGFESGSDSVLRAMNKRVDTGSYRTTIKLLRKLDMPFIANFTVGMPDETETTIDETEKFCIENDLIFGPSYVTPFPGTKLYEDVKDRLIPNEKAYIDGLADMNYSKKPVLNLTVMPTEKLVKLRDRAVVNSVAHLIGKKARWLPASAIKALCRIHLRIFDIKNPAVAGIIHRINNIIYSFFSKKGPIRPRAGYTGS